MAELYELPEGWRWVKLGEVVKEDRNIINPQDYPNKDFWLVTMDCIESDTGKLLKIIKVKGKKIKSTKYCFNSNHILYGKLRPYLNKVYVPNEEGICTTEFIPFIPTGVDKKYIAFYLRTKEVVKFAMNNLTGTRQPRVNIETLFELQIPLPPLLEQKRIVARIEELFSKLDEVKKLRKEALEQTKTLLKATLHRIFSKADEKRWRWVKLGEETLFHIETGSTPKTDVEEYWKGGNIKWITPKDLGKVSGKFIFDTERCITQAGLKSCSATVVPRGSIVISTRAPIGHIAITGDEMCFNQGCKGIVIKDKNQIFNDFLYYALLTKIEELQKLGSGATFKEISKRKLASIQIPLPPLHEQKRIVAYLDKIQQKVQSLQALQETTEEEIKKLRESILHKAFRGEL